MDRLAKKLEQLKDAKSEGAVPKSTNAMRSLMSQPTSNQTALLDRSRFLRVYGGAGEACSACHAPLTAEALTQQSHVRAKETVKKIALELMQDHRRNIANARDSYSKDDRGNDLDPVTKQGRVEKAVAAARAIEDLGRLNEQLTEDEAGLRLLGAKARRAGGHFDPDWIGDLRQLISHASNETVEKAFAEFEADVRRPEVSQLAKNGALQVAVMHLEKWRIKQREELALNLGVLYTEFPFFGTHILPSLLVRVADMPRGTVVPPENQIAMGFATLLENIDDVIERIASDKIDPLNLPQAIAVAEGRMQLSEWVALQELLDEKKRQERAKFLLSLTLPFGLAMLPLLGAVAVGVLGAGAAAAADVAAAIELGGNTAAAVAGGIMFLGEAEEASNRFALEAASGSHDRSLLGVPALGGDDTMMLVIDGILVAAGLFVAARGIQGHVERKAGSGNPPPVSSGKDVNQGITDQGATKGKSINDLAYELGMSKPPVSDASPKALAGGKSIDKLQYELGMSKPPPAGRVKASVPGSGKLPDPAAIDWLSRNKLSQPPREQPQLHLPAERTPSLNPAPTESRIVAPAAPKRRVPSNRIPEHSNRIPEQPTSGQLGVKVNKAEVKGGAGRTKIKERKGALLEKKRAEELKKNPAFEDKDKLTADEASSTSWWNANEELSVVRQARVSAANGKYVIEQPKMLGVLSNKEFVSAEKLVEAAGIKTENPGIRPDVAEVSQFSISDNKLKAGKVDLGDYKSADKLAYLNPYLPPEKIEQAAGSFQRMVAPQVMKQNAVIEYASKNGGVVLFRGRVAGTNELVIFHVNPGDIKVSPPMPYGGTLNQ